MLRLPPAHFTSGDGVFAACTCREVILSASPGSRTLVRILRTYYTICMTRKSSTVPFYQNGGVTLYYSDALRVLRRMPDESIDMVFADPPYLLSNGGISCQNGKMVSVNKGDWDQSRGVDADYRWNRKWLAECQRVLKPNGTIWVSGTNHNIYLVGHAMQSLGYRVLNDIAWLKPNAAPNLSCRYFTHSHETILWAAKSRDSKHTFNYADMKSENDGKQMRSYWTLAPPKAAEKLYGKHPTQKPLQLMRRIVLASTRPEDLVLDPFAGSGTTGVAAVNCGCRFVGVESSLHYVEIAARRLAET